MHRTTGVGTLGQGEAGGGGCLCGTPVGAAIGAVLPSGTWFHTAHCHARGAGDVVSWAVACVDGQGQAWGRWRGGVQGEGLAVDSAVVACGIGHLHFHGVAAGEGLPAEAPGVLSHGGGGRGPGAAIVQGHRNSLASGQVVAQGAADGLRRRFGDEVTGAAARVCTEGSGGDGGGRRGGVQGIGLAEHGACIVARSIAHLDLQSIAAGQCLPGEAPGVLTHGGGGRGPGAAVVQRHRDRLASSQVRTQVATDGLRCRLGDEVSVAAARVCTQGHCGDGGRGRGGVHHETGVVSHQAVGQGGVITRCVSNGASVQAQTVGVDADAVGVSLPWKNGVSESQQTSTAATGITGLHRSAVDVQSESWCTCHGDCFTHGHSCGHHIACIQVAVLHVAGSRDGHGAHRGRDSVNLRTNHL